ncbi:hypothetical protein LLAPH_506_0048 [Lactococcus phage ASCC506]|uniref:Uncharacterized protein n=10 Tax=Skunavirus ASCC273 TaxID=1165135 RepID=H9EGQ9_9CAUD|nr:hypothetical protein LLAPH_273_0048 [Lactococcus phage ASCC273]AFE87013.1 hypothetical protein LLAPH_287_0048 [Lactococcus phage ASCC287]AFE87184.1 hypothetical protein LLAPH_337_0048 [Lactococcus phage ASCC337]AFE87410.1 hypothetical protein LLAPH_368_0048 [Lactococcus phage ASCC368]AFE87468.1 hypothetical protein LLAPH_395_0048 [Lactococcus phage ASCC395]AFE87585.1 hypothetical protein LLAPH_406_0048 [Lactococcus phage ASCC406]AFE87876.1 hypothetical protein LLAPH_502_0048 [Lactococcus p
MVKLTKEQADFLKSFNDKSRAFYYISSWGWGNFLKNGIGEVYERGVKTPFTIDEKEKMLNAIINGYEVIESKYKFYNFSDSSGGTPLYYAGLTNELKGNKKFALEVKKDSEEYKALLTLGFIEEEI